MKNYMVLVCIQKDLGNTTHRYVNRWDHMGLSDNKAIAEAEAVSRAKDTLSGTDVLVKAYLVDADDAIRMDVEQGVRP